MTAATQDENYYPSLQDGKGSAVVEPDADVLINSFGTWKVIYTAEGEGIREGGGLVIHISPWWGWTPPQTTFPDEPGYVTVTTSSPEAHLETFINRELHWVKIVVEDGDIRSGETIALTYGDPQGREDSKAYAKCDKFAEDGEEFMVKVDGDGDGFFMPITRSPVLNILPDGAVELLLAVPSLVDVDESFHVTVAAVDYNMNRATAYEGAVRLVCLKKGLEFAADISFTPEDGGAKKIPVTARSRGTYHLIAVDKENDLACKSNPVVVGSPHFKEKLYWGDIHGHTNLSDGSATPDQYYTYARDVSGLQVAAITDHDALGLIALDEAPEIWAHLKRMSRKYNSPGTFITFPAYEYTNFTTGHKHVLFLDEDEGDILSYRDPQSDTPDKLWAGLKGKQVMTISHHPGGGPAAQNWNYFDPAFETVVEICSIHGSSEFFGAPQGIYSPEQGTFVQDALAKGYRLGFVGSGDTHNGHPGQGDPGVITSGLAGFFAESLTRESIWSAIKSRTVYATSGDRIILGFWLNETLMGKTYQAGKNEQAAIKVFAVGKYKISRVDIIKNNQDLYSELFGKKEEVTLRFSDKTSLEHEDFYYARVTQEDGTMAWSSPVWIEIN